MMRYNNCGAAVTAADAIEQRKIARNPGGPTQYPISNASYPRRHPSCKNERGEDSSDGSNGVQAKPEQYMARKVAAAPGGPGSQWY